MNAAEPIHTQFVETRTGIFTSSGNWFYTTSDAIEKFAPGLLRSVTLETLIDEAELWVRSSDAVAILFLIVSIHVFPLGIAVLLTPVIFLLWHLNRSALTGPVNSAIIRYLLHDAVVFIAAVASISLAGMYGDTTSAVVSIFIFLMLRFGWLRKISDLALERNTTHISFNDRILKMLIIKYALKMNLHVDQIQKMEKEILERMLKKRKTGSNG